MALVVGAEVERLQNLRHHAAVMPLTAVADDGPQRLPIFDGRLSLPDQIAQRLLVGDQEAHSRHYAVRLLQRSRRDLEQDAWLAVAMGLQILQQRPVYLAPRPRADLMDGLDQQIDQVVRQLAAAQVSIGRQRRKPGRLRVTAKLVRRFGRNPPPVTLQLVRKRLREEIMGQVNLASIASRVNCSSRLATLGRPGSPRNRSQPRRHGFRPFSIF